MVRVSARYVLLFLAGMASFGSGAQFAEGVNYIELNPSQPTIDSSRIVITEFFSYQCPHCFSFDPVLESWADELPDDVVFERVPISIGYQQWVPIAQAFHALRAMGQLEERHMSIFRAIHVNGEQLYDKASIVEWLRDRGIDTDAFSDMYDSFSITRLVRGGEQKSIAHPGWTAFRR